MSFLCDDGTLKIETAEVFDPLLPKRRYRGASGGRGSAKSWHFGGELILDMSSEHTRAVCGREIQLSIADSSKQLLEDKIRAFGLEDQFRITDKEIVCPEFDSLCIFRGFSNQTATSIKSLEAFNRLWVDEAAGLTQRSLEIVTPTFRKNATMDFSWNPEKEDDPIEQWFREAGCQPDGKIVDPDYVWVHATYHDNPWFPDELRRDMERDRRRDIDRYNHIWLGRHKKVSKARVFHNWEIVDFATPPTGPRFYFGADWGFAVDPTCLIRAWQGKLIGDDVAVPHPQGDKLFIDFEVYGVGVEIDNTPAFFAGDDDPRRNRWANPNKYKGIPGALQWPMTADSARPETISYMRNRGFQITPSVKGKGSVEDGIEFIKTFDLVIHPRCVNMIRELTNYQYKIDKRTNEILPVLDEQTFHANLIHALRYALEGTRRSNYSLAAVG